MTRIEGWIKAVILLAIGSMVLSIAVFLYPFAVPVDLSTRSEISSAISTVFALVMGTIAIIIAAGIERTEYRARETLREDLARLSAALHSLLTKAGAILAARGQNIPVAANFEAEKSVFNDIICSTTGYAFVCWIGEKSEAASAAGKEGEAWRVFVLVLSELQLRSDEDLPDYVYHNFQTIDELLGLIESLDEQSVRAISKYLDDLSSTRYYKRSNDELVIVQALRGRTRSMPPAQLPSEDIIDQTLAAAANEGSSFLAEVNDILERARTGDQESIRYFNSLSQTLLSKRTD